MIKMFFQILNEWFIGMVVVMTIYHISTYFFTKDKSFLFYALHLILLTLVFFFVISSSNTILPIEKNLTTYHNSTLWFLFFLVWMSFGWFFYFYMDIQKKIPKLAKEVKIYLFINILVISTLFCIDFYFFNQKYFFKYIFLGIYLPIGCVFVVWILFSIRNYYSQLKPFFIVGFLPFLVFSLYFIYAVRFPHKKFSNVIHPLFLLELGAFLQLLIVSIGLGYKYQLLRIEKNSSDKLLIKELQKNQELKNIINNKLNEKATKASKELEKAIEITEKHKIEQIENKYKGELEKLRLNSLLSNMNPHFLFNSLNSVKSYIIDNNPKKASYYLNKFSKLIRKILDASNETQTTLLEELKTMRLYTSIENIRFNNEIKFEFNIIGGINLEAISVPPLFLHSFIENAIWLGVASKKGNKKIQVTASSSKTHIILTIKDNGIGRNKAIQILNTKKFKSDKLTLFDNIQRLTLFYKDYKNKYHIHYTDLLDNNNIGIGTLVTLKIPLI